MNAELNAEPQDIEMGEEKTDQQDAKGKRKSSELGENGHEEGALETQNEKDKVPRKMRKSSTMQVAREVESETTHSDTHETTLTKAMNVTVKEDILTKEDDGEGDEEMVMSKVWEVEGNEEEGTPALRVSACCSIHRQENVAKTIITGGSLFISLYQIFALR